jgi:hypothetical protein
VKILNSRFGLLSGKPPDVSSIVVVWAVAPVPLAALMTTVSVLAAVAATPDDEKQLRRTPPPSERSSVAPSRIARLVSDAPQRTFIVRVAASGGRARGGRQGGDRGGREQGAAEDTSGRREGRDARARVQVHEGASP